MTDPAKSGEAGQSQPQAMAPGGTAANPAAPAAEAATVDPVLALEAMVKELESQKADLTDRMLRAHAEMDNLRKRTEREKADAAKYAISKFALDIVGISDNFQRAVASVPAVGSEVDGTLKSLVEGVMMTERAFLQVLEKHGVRRIDPQGQPFNPNVHQAVMHQDDASVPASTVLQVFQPGYMIEDRVLRPAMVVVSRGGARPAAGPRPVEPAPEPPSPASNDNSGTAGT